MHVKVCCPHTSVYSKQRDREPGRTDITFQIIFWKIVGGNLQALYSEQEAFISGTLNVAFGVGGWGQGTAMVFAPRLGPITALKPQLWWDSNPQPLNHSTKCNLEVQCTIYCTTHTSTLQDSISMNRNKIMFEENQYNPRTFLQENNIFAAFNSGQSNQMTCF